MMLKTPSFWYGEGKGVEKHLPSLLAPLGRLYGWAARQRFDLHYPVPLARAVICVGNLVAGGAGKTPVVMALTALLQEKGRNPHILTRGYGGTEEGPLQVAASRDTAADVGDEALLLVDAAPVWVSKSRPLGAQAAIDTGADVIVMDDGFQNPLIYKDFSFVVVDGGAGFGNGLVFPAGPLREELAFGLSRADAAIIIGDDKADARAIIAKHVPDLPVFAASLRPVADNPDLFGKEVFAFAGIGRPEKFRDTLIAAGAMVEGWSEFPDHYAYAEEDLKELMDAAAARNAIVVTTAKDHVRLPQNLRDRVKPFRVALAWQDADAVWAALNAMFEGRF